MKSFLQQLVVVVLMIITFAGCKKEGAEANKMVPIELELPKPVFVGTPENLQGVTNLEKPLGQPRPPFLAPERAVNLSSGKPVTSSESEPIFGELSMIVDGDKKARDGSIVELGPFKQWIQIDLEQQCELYAIVVWHFHKTPRAYLDVVVQISNDPGFKSDALTVFNNDRDNSLGLGAGSDMNYVETAEGKLINANRIHGQYVRLYSAGNNSNDMNHYTEVEVYGRPIP